MATRVAEYLGHNSIAAPTPWIVGHDIPLCPFYGLPCAKLNRKKPQKPLCSVWADDELWITCEHRLMTALKSVPMTFSYLQVRALEIAEILWGAPVDRNNVAVSRQHTVAGLNADYIFALNPQWRAIGTPLRYSMEIQGGGDTTASGNLTRHIEKWEENPTEVDLVGSIGGVQPNYLNVWKRLLSQLVTKGLAATKVRQGVGCIVGKRLFDDIDSRTGWAKLQPPEDGYVDFVVIPYKTANPTQSPVQLVPDRDRVIRSTFLLFLEQMRLGGIDADFSGRYHTLDGDPVDAF